LRRPAVRREYSGDEWGLYSMRAVRTEAAKYVYSPHGTDELYDLAADPHEGVNLIDDPGRAALAAAPGGRLPPTHDPLALWAQRLL
jgi:arylsulfatase A-like enzyme